MKVIFLNNSNQIAQWTAHHIVYRINSFQPTQNNPFILSLPSGNTPIQTYKNLIKIYQSHQVSFKHVIIFTMSEYFGYSYNNPNSYYFFLNKNFINHVDILKKNVHVLNGKTDTIDLECKKYENNIKKFGGIHLLISGVGKDGNLAFNDPGSSLYSRTRLKILSKNMRLSNAKFFNNQINSVPKFALTVGIATILDSKEIIILAFGLNKSKAVHAAVEGNINHMWPVSYLQMHPDTILICDKLSSMNLTLKTIQYFRNLEMDGFRY